MSSKTKVGVGIPCYKPHLATLWRLLDSIATQTVVPDIVVVETSSTSDVDVDASKLGHYGFELHVIAVPERRNASENRNATIQLLLDNNCTIISMLDADDIMHPQRMEFVHAAIDAGAEIVLHNFTSDMTGALPLYAAPKVEIGTIFPMTNWCEVRHVGGKQLHHAHVTFTDVIARKFKYRPEKQYERTEDSWFCNDVLKSGHVPAYVDNVLSRYVPAGSWVC